MAVQRLAISNIAWDEEDRAAVVSVLHREGVEGVELAPTKWRPNPFEATPADIAALRDTWNDDGLAIVSLQSLLFGRPDLQLFGEPSSRRSLAEYLVRAADFASALGARVLVFGSPKNRMRGALPIVDAFGIAADFFREIAPSLVERNCCICIEANPAQYGCDFVTTTSEAITLCRSVDSPAIGVNADLGGMTMAGENPSVEIEAAGSLIRHVHASESNLAVLGAGADHRGAAAALEKIGYEGWVSIEMRASGPGHNVGAVERAVAVATASYRST